MISLLGDLNLSDGGGLQSVLLVAIAVGCYFIGNINPAILIGRAHGIDVRSEGSGNAGMTNAMRTIGKRAGIATFIIDALKGLLPTLAIMHFLSDGFGLLCGILVIVGHIWPALFKFKGGKGVSTCFGVLVALDWKLALIMLAIVLLVAVITKRVSAGTLIACICAVPVCYFLERSSIPALSAVIALIVWSHRGNIARIIKGTEPKMSFGKK